MNTLKNYIHYLPIDFAFYFVKDLKVQKLRKINWILRTLINFQENH